MPPEPRVVLVLGPSTGGVGRHVADLARGLVARDVAVAVCGPPAVRDRFDWGPASFVPVALSRRPGREAAHVRRTLRAAAAGALVVHAHGALPAAACVAAGIGPLVVSWHNAPTGSRLRRLGHRVADRLAAGSADLVLVASPDLAAAARRAGARAVRFMPLPAPPLPAPSGPPARLRARFGLGNRPVVLAVARLAPQKRLDLLVRAAAGWTEPQSPVVLVAGSGPEEARLRGLAAQLGAPVRFLGHRDDVADLLAVADVAVLPSEWEARPFVVQEALRAGVPVVATAVGGIPHLVQGGAVLVPPDDVSALRAAVHDLLDDPVRRARLADAGREVASHWPTYGATVDEYLSTYLDLKARCW